MLISILFPKGNEDLGNLQTYLNIDFLPKLAQITIFLSESP